MPITIIKIERPDENQKFQDLGISSDTCELCIRHYPELPEEACEDCSLNPLNVRKLPQAANARVLKTGEKKK